MPSILLSSLVDVLFVAAAVVAAAFLWTHARAIRFAGAVVSIQLLSAGLIVWASYYFFDIILILFGPLFLSEARLLAWMGLFESRVRWITDLTAVLLLLAGFVSMLNRLGALLTALQSSTDALQLELTSRDTLEAELKSEAEAERAFRQAKSEFVLGLSHELRTPLNGILGLASLLANTELDKDQRKLLTTLEQSAQTMLGRVSDVLDLSLLENGRVELRSLSFQPADLTRTVAALFEPLAQERGLDFVVQASDAAAQPVIGDPGRVKQILTQLLSNAFKFTPAGRVGLEVDVVPVDQEHARLVFTISDTGIGIPADRLKDVSAARALKTGADAGIGLSICWRLTTLMQGSLTFDSAPDQGTRVRAEILAQPDPGMIDAD